MWVALWAYYPVCGFAAASFHVLSIFSLLSRLSGKPHCCRGCAGGITPGLWVCRRQRSCTRLPTRFPRPSTDTPSLSVSSDKVSCMLFRGSKLIFASSSNNIYPDSVDHPVSLQLLLTGVLLGTGAHNGTVVRLRYVPCFFVLY